VHWYARSSSVLDPLTYFHDPLTLLSIDIADDSNMDLAYQDLYMVRDPHNGQLVS
jgi:hypothetical protein